MSQTSTLSLFLGEYTDPEGHYQVIILSAKNIDDAERKVRIVLREGSAFERIQPLEPSTSPTTADRHWWELCVEYEDGTRNPFMFIEDDDLPAVWKHACAFISNQKNSPQIVYVMSQYHLPVSEEEDDD